MEWIWDWSSTPLLGTLQINPYFAANIRCQSLVFCTVGLALEQLHQKTSDALAFSSHSLPVLTTFTREPSRQESLCPQLGNNGKWCPGRPFPEEKKGNGLARAGGQFAKGKFPVNWNNAFPVTLKGPGAQDSWRTAISLLKSQLLRLASPTS